MWKNDWNAAFTKPKHNIKPVCLLPCENVPGGEERGETDVFTGYVPLWNCIIIMCSFRFCMYDIFFRYFFLEKKIANFSKQSSGLVSLVIGAYWNPDLWKF